MKVVQIFEEDFPDNKKEIFNYISKFYYNISVITKENNNGWLINIEKTQFLETFTKHSEGDVFQEYKKEAEYYLAFNDKGDEIGLLVIAPQTWNKTARIWDLFINKESQ